MTASAAPSPQAGPPQAARDRRSLWAFLRFITGLALLSGLGYFLWTPGDWANKLFVWVLLTILADECGGWFGYLALALGALIFFAPGATPEQWFVVAPLVGGALFALLLVKHSGGPFVLPFAGALFAGAVLGAEKLGDMLGTPIKLVGSPELHRMAILPMLLALAFSFVRQLVEMLLRWHAGRPPKVVTTTVTTTPPDPDPAPAPATPAQPADPAAAPTKPVGGQPTRKLPSKKP